MIWFLATYFFLTVCFFLLVPGIGAKLNCSSRWIGQIPDGGDLYMSWAQHFCACTFVKREKKREREREKKNEQRKRKNRSKENEKNNKGKGNNEQENDRSKGVQRSWFAKRTLFCNGLQPSNSLPLSEKEHRVFFASLWESLSEFLRISLSLSQDGREWRRHKGPSPDGHVTRRKREETSINLILVARPGAPSSEHCS